MKGGASGTWLDNKGDWEPKIPALLAVRISVCLCVKAESKVGDSSDTWVKSGQRQSLSTQRERRGYIEKASKCITISKKR